MEGGASTWQGRSSKPAGRRSPPRAARSPTLAGGHCTALPVDSTVLHYPVGGHNALAVEQPAGGGFRGAGVPGRRVRPGLPGNGRPGCQDMAGMAILVGRTSDRGLAPAMARPSPP
jgi:hypothetical protein